MVKVPLNYPIGTPGLPWGDAERRLWLETRSDHPSRCHEADVTARLRSMASEPCMEGAFDVVKYGTVEGFPLLAAVPSSSFGDGGGARGTARASGAGRSRSRRPPVHARGVHEPLQPAGALRLTRGVATR